MFTSVIHPPIACLVEYLGLDEAVRRCARLSAGQIRHQKRVPYGSGPSGRSALAWRRMEGRRVCGHDTNVWPLLCSGDFFGGGQRVAQIMTRAKA